MEIFKLICCLTLFGGLVEIVNSQRNPSNCPTISGFNGRIKYRGRKKVKAVFICAKNEQRYGPRKLNCRQDGTWDKEMPVCIKSGCVPVDISQSTYLDMTEEYSGALLKFSCEESYSLIGAMESYCDGMNWNNPIPTCVAPHELTECDFETDLCGWTQDDTDESQWTRLAGATPTGNTGPKHDHTLEDKGTGHYMVFEASNPTSNGDQARLISPEYTPDMSPMCFDFWYHSLGPDDAGHVGSLEVYVVGRSEFVDDLQPLFYKEGNQGDMWHRGEIDIDEMTEPYTIVIEATRKLSYISDIAIDDVRLFNCTVETTTTTTTTMAPSTSSQPPAITTINTPSLSSKKSATSITTKGSTGPTTKIYTTITPSQQASNKTEMSSTVNATQSSSLLSTTTTTPIASTTSSKLSSSKSLPSPASSTARKLISVHSALTKQSTTPAETTTIVIQTSSMRSTDMHSTTQLSTNGTTMNRLSTTTKLSTQPSIVSSSTPPSTTTILITSPTSPDKTKTTTAQTSTTGATKPSTSATSKSTTDMSTSSKSTDKPTKMPTTTAPATTPPTTPRTTQTLSSRSKISESSSSSNSSPKTTSASSTASSQSRSPTSIPAVSPTVTPKTSITNSSATDRNNSAIGKTNPTAKTSTGSSQTNSSLSVTVKTASEHPADETLKPLMIGLGVGIVAGLIIIGVIAYVCVRRRKFYTRGYGDELKPITNATSTQSINNVQYYHDHDEEYEN